MNSYILVVIIDTHALVRETLRQTISTFPGICVCASLNALECVDTIAWQPQAQVAILCSSLSLSLCLDLVKVIQEGNPAMRFVAIRQNLNPETTITCIKRGIQGLLGEEASKGDLARAITAAATGNTFLDAQARSLLDHHLASVPLHLTRRETDVLALLKDGLSNYQIAHHLGIGEKAVEKHLTRLYGKLRVQSRSGAILQAQQLYL